MLKPRTQKRLVAIKKSAKELFYAGANLSEYDTLTLVAIVGSRKPTPYGKQMTQKIAADLAKQRVVIVSGLAIGIDGFAHQAALDVGGRSIAVLPSGLSSIYPAMHAPLARKIIDQQGTLLSEYEHDHNPRKFDFLDRNRLIAAISDLVIIPEAAAGSGSLNTAKHAKAMGVPVAVIPGNITSPMSKGTNQLLREGALCITDAADILALLDVKPLALSKVKHVKANDQESAILQELEKGHSSLDQLQAATSMSTSELQSTVTMLEIEGHVTQSETGEYRLV